MQNEVLFAKYVADLNSSRYLRNRLYAHCTTHRRYSCLCRLEELEKEIQDDVTLMMINSVTTGEVLTVLHTENRGHETRQAQLTQSQLPLQQAAPHIECCHQGLYVDGEALRMANLVVQYIIKNIGSTDDEN